LNPRHPAGGSWLMALGGLSEDELNPLVEAWAVPARAAANTQQRTAQRFIGPLYHRRR
jgi:hypothetical protein